MNLIVVVKMVFSMKVFNVQSLGAYIVAQRRSCGEVVGSRECDFEVFGGFQDAKAEDLILNMRLATSSPMNSTAVVY